jgi:DNA polymerase III epsilon subunit family exonuclease
MNDFLKKFEFVAFDTETTGLSAVCNRIVEIGAVKFNLDGSTIETFQSLVNPERLIPESVTAIHGIDDEMVKDAETIKPVLKRFITFCGENSILIAHNAKFDISFIGYELGRTGMNFGKNPVVDTIRIYRRLHPGLQSYSLDSLIYEFEIATRQEHRALEDAEMVQELFLNVREKFLAINSLTQFESSYGFSYIKAQEIPIVNLPVEYYPIAQAMKDEIWVELIYQSNGKEPSNRKVLPVDLYAVGYSIYMDAFCEIRQEVRTFRLDRILRFKVLT